jgi:outer membrane protein assembly factor BamB
MNRVPSLRTRSLTVAVVLLGMSTGGCTERSRSANPDPAPGVEKASMISAGAPSGDSKGVLTYHNDIARTGQYLAETVLTTDNVNDSSFGKVGFLHVQGLVDAEPLYVSKLKIAGASHNVVFVATEHGLAYAFDADTYRPLWKVSLVGAGETTSDNRQCQQITPEIGITATPVIDLKAGPHGTIYIVAMSKDARGHYFQRLHALDITTGAELSGGPQTIGATFPGSGAASVRGEVIFDPKQYEERAALLLLNGVIYTTWASHCDHDPYTGWVMGFSASTLKPVAVLDLTPNGNEGATWMTGDGPAADASGNIYLLTANGTFDIALDESRFPSHGDFGNAFVKISTVGNKLAVADYFTTHDTVAESNKDEDLGAGGVLLLPDLKDSYGNVRHLAIGAGKDQIIYVVNRDSMGKFDAGGDQVHEEIPGALGGAEFATPAYFNNVVYYGAALTSLKAFPTANAFLAKSPVSETSAKFDYPGTTPSISANGASNGIVWAVECDGNRGVLHAYDATNLARELYRSGADGSGSQFADNKFIAPMIADGRVYIGTPTGVIVFGLLKEHPAR